MARADRGGLRTLLTRIAPIVLLLPMPVMGQGIKVVTQVAPVSALSISDVDFLNATTPKWLFTISIANNTGRPQISVVMQITLQVVLADGESYANAVTLVTRAFTVDGIRNITNLDIARGGSIRDSMYTKDPDAKRRFEQVALPSGILPAGSYKFGITVTELQGQASGGDMFSIVLTNPSSVELVFPFDGDNAVNQFPLFQWNFDGPSSKLSIFEKLPGQSTLEETASGVPQLTADVRGTSYQYPASGVRPLLPGRTYVWYVEGQIVAAGGMPNVLRSALRSFTVADAGVAAGYSLLDAIEAALDPKYKPIFDQIRADGYAPSATVRLNGSPVSQPDLTRVIEQLHNDPDAVLSVTIE